MLTAGQDGQRHLMRFGGGHNELDMRGRLLQSLEQGIERLRGKHVDLVDYIDTVAAAGRQVLDVLPQFPHRVYTPVGSAVYLQHIYRGSRDYLTAGGALVTGMSRGPRLTVERFGQYPGHRGLAYPARPAEKVGVSHPVALDRAHQGAGYLLLGDHLRECLRPPLSSQN